MIILLCFSFCLFSGCKEKKNSDTRIMMDTVVTITARCPKELINRAFDLCAELEKKLSRTAEGSDVWKINNLDGFVEVSDETVFLINKSLDFFRLSDGKFDITVCPVSSLYDFSSGVLPKEEEISKAVLSVDCRKIEINGNQVKIEEGSIDLGGIAKGYIADRAVAFLKENGVKEGIINIGGNLFCFGEGDFDVGIRKPFENSVIATVKGKEGTYVTSGIYERYIEKDGRIYHHIIDPSTGYGVENDLASVTVLGSSSADADALSTTCMLLGSEKGIGIIENTPNTEAVFIKRDGTVLLSSGLKQKDTVIVYK